LNDDFTQETQRQGEDRRALSLCLRVSESVPSDVARVLDVRAPVHISQGVLSIVGLQQSPAEIQVFAVSHCQLPVAQ